ncbi:hypothetical protein Pelo_5265 [Pelomyxa schiedti]|nr:hypothetical protein Pelo_5265 [Pelomyxa schiedti]
MLGSYEYQQQQQAQTYDEAILAYYQQLLDVDAQHSSYIPAEILEQLQQQHHQNKQSAALLQRRDEILTAAQPPHQRQQQMQMQMQIQTSEAAAAAAAVVAANAALQQQQRESEYAAQWQQWEDYLSAAAELDRQQLLLHNQSELQYVLQQQRQRQQRMQGSVSPMVPLCAPPLLQQVYQDHSQVPQSPLLLRQPQLGILDEPNRILPIAKLNPLQSLPICQQPLQLVSSSKPAIPLKPSALLNSKLKSGSLVPSPPLIPSPQQPPLIPSTLKRPLIPIPVPPPSRFLPPPPGALNTLQLLSNSSSLLPGPINHIRPFTSPSAQLLQAGSMPSWSLLPLLGNAPGLVNNSSFQMQCKFPLSGRGPLPTATLSLPTLTPSPGRGAPLIPSIPPPSPLGSPQIPFPRLLPHPQGNLPFIPPTPALAAVSAARAKLPPAPLGSKPFIPIPPPPQPQSLLSTPANVMPQGAGVPPYLRAAAAAAVLRPSIAQPPRYDVNGVLRHGRVLPPHPGGRPY